MGSESEPTQPGILFARRLARVRELRGWSQDDLAHRLQEVGFPVGRATIAKIESAGRSPTGATAGDRLTRAEKVTLAEVFAFAVALGVLPVHLITPADDEEMIALSPKEVAPAPLARAWVSGHALLDSSDPAAVIAAMPPSEARKYARAAITRGLTPLQLAFVDQTDVDERAEDLAWEVTEGDAVRRRETKGDTDG